MPRKRKHPAEQYIDDVVKGRITTGRLVQLAVDRHLRWMKDAEKMGYVHSPAHAQHAIDFAHNYCRHTKGEWQRQPIQLSPWQQFVRWVVFGWLYTETSFRVIRYVYEQVARKNGKSTDASTLAHYLFVGDGEPGADIYAVATKRDQAKIVWEDAMRMVQMSPELSEEIKIYRSVSHLVHEATFSKFLPLGALEDKADGLNPHGSIVDELHAQKNRGMFDIMDTAQGARRQPLLWIITTAADRKDCVCREERDYCVDVLEGTIPGDHVFAFICELDEDDDPYDPANWPKANPNLGVSVQAEEIARAAEKAKHLGGLAENSFLQKRLNIWVENTKRFIDLEIWKQNANPFKPETLRGQSCVAGLDLSTKIDLTAYTLLFPPQETEGFILAREKIKETEIELADAQLNAGPETIEKITAVLDNAWQQYLQAAAEMDPWRILCRFFMPEDNIAEMERRDRLPYRKWVQAGLITATPGNMVDYRHVQRSIIEDRNRHGFDIREIGFDPWNAAGIEPELTSHDFEMIEVRQGARSLSEPMKTVQALAGARMLAHNGNPVMAAHCAHLQARKDPNDNWAPDKRNSKGRIDGMVSLFTAFHLALKPTEDKSSVYEKEGILFI